MTDAGATAAGPDAGLHLDIEVSVGGFTVRAALHVAPGEVLALVGPNAAGKTSLLRALAGLVPITRGAVHLGGRTLDAPDAGIRVPPEARSVGLVFQDHLLFPHLSALDNVAFGLRARGVPRRQAQARAGDWLERMSLAGVAARGPSELSGGQAQRVGIARALATEPALLLLDEPLAALDVQTRLDMRRELRRHLDGFAGPCLLVTHEPVDAVALADRLAVLEDGRIVQTGPVAEVARRPRSAWAARLVGLNLYRGRADAGRIALGADLGLASATDVRGEAFAVVHPRAVALHRERPSGSPRNVWRGPVTGIDAYRDSIRVHVGGPMPIVAEITPAAAADLRIAQRADIWVAVKASEVEMFPA